MSQARLAEALAPTRQEKTGVIATSTAIVSTAYILTVVPGNILAVTYGTWVGVSGKWQWATSVSATYWHTLATFLSGAARAQRIEIGAGGVVRASLGTYTSGTLQWSAYQGF